MLSRARCADEGEKDWRVVPGGDEELHREATGLQRALHGKIFPAHWNAAAVVAGSGQGLRSRLHEIGQTAVRAADGGLESAAPCPSTVRLRASTGRSRAA